VSTETDRSRHLESVLGDTRVQNIRCSDSDSTETELNGAGRAETATRVDRLGVEKTDSGRISFVSVDSADIL